jgi:predicted nucleic acid-binding protein
MTSFARIYLDTNILIGIAEDASADGDRLRQVVSAHGAGCDARLLTSQLTFSELLVRPYRDRNFALAEFYFNLSAGAHWLETIAVSAEILEAAAVIRTERRSLKLPDAIHIASAMVSGCSHLLTHDRGIVDTASIAHPFRRDVLPEMSVIRPDSQTLSAVIKDISS